MFATDSVPTDVLELKKPTPAQLALVRADPRMEAQVASRGALTLLSCVPDEGAFDAFLTFKADGNFVSVALHKGMDRPEVLEAIRAALPPGYEATVLGGSEAEVLIVNVLRVPNRTAAVPYLAFAVTDPNQRLSRVTRNKIAIDGQTTRGLVHAAEVQLEIDGDPVRVPLEGGTSPYSTAVRIRDALPRKYTAILELPRYEGDEVALTVVRRRSLP